MLLQKFWKKRVMVIGAMVFILTLFALNLNALVKGKVEVTEANALPGFWIHFKKKLDLGGGTYLCYSSGFQCIVIDLANGEKIQIPLPT